MKTRRLMMIMALMLFGGIFSGCAGGDAYRKAVDTYKDTRIMATNVNKKIIALETKLKISDEEFDKLSKEQEVYFTKYDKNGDGKLDLTEAKDPEFIAMIYKAFSTGDWKTLLLLLVMFFGLHIMKMKSKFKQYVLGPLGMAKTVTNFASYSDEDLKRAEAEKVIREERKRVVADS